MYPVFPSRDDSDTRYNGDMSYSCPRERGGNYNQNQMMKWEFRGPKIHRGKNCNWKALRKWVQVLRWWWIMAMQVKAVNAARLKQWRKAVEEKRCGCGLCKPATYIQQIDPEPFSLGSLAGPAWSYPEDFCENLKSSHLLLNHVVEL